MDSSAHTVEPKSAAEEDLSAAASSRRSTSRRGRRAHVKNIVCGHEELADDDEKAEVEQKIVALQKIIPGGEMLPVEELFEETAEYIFALESQVKALRLLAAFLQSSEKMKKRKLGG